MTPTEIIEAYGKAEEDKLFAGLTDAYLEAIRDDFRNQPGWLSVAASGPALAARIIQEELLRRRMARDVVRMANLQAANQAELKEWKADREGNHAEAVRILTEPNAEPTYYIQDTRSYVGNSVLWWRENGQGYTTDIDDAGVYSEAESARICKNRATEKRIPVNVARAAVVRSVDAGKLFEEMAKQTGKP